MKPSGAVHIARLLRAITNITILNLDNSGLLDEGIELIFDALPSNHSLRHLYVSANGITECGAFAIAKYLMDFVQVWIQQVHDWD